MSNPYRDKLLGIGVIGRRTRDRVREGRDDNGRWKTTRDQLGNDVTQRHDARGSECQDVTIRAPQIQVVAQTREVRG